MGHSRAPMNMVMNQSVSYTNIKIIMFLGGKVRRVHRADNLTAFYEPTV
jgi:hypothetical protein